jgi:hypothetical protein
MLICIEVCVFEAEEMVASWSELFARYGRVLNGFCQLSTFDRLIVDCNWIQWVFFRRHAFHALRGLASVEPHGSGLGIAMNSRKAQDSCRLVSGKDTLPAQ